MFAPFYSHLSMITKLFFTNISFLIANEPKKQKKGKKKLILLKYIYKGKIRLEQIYEYFHTQNMYMCIKHTLGC